MSKPMIWRWMAVLATGGALCGCQSQVRLSPDFGSAVRQDVVAQIADPDARYAGTPQPGANPARVSLAQRRYVAGRVIPPASTSTSSVSGGGNDGGTGGPAAPPGP